MDPETRRLNDFIVDEVEGGADMAPIFEMLLADRGLAVRNEPPEDDEDAAARHILSIFYRETGVVNTGWALQRAESPIEKIFLVHFVLAAWNHHPRCLSPPLAFFEEVVAQTLERDGPRQGGLQAQVVEELWTVGASIWFVPQVVPTDWPAGRAPFEEDDRRLDALEGIRLDLVVGRPSVNDEMLVVECDGYRWHKDNFTEDRQRDRLLRRAGMDVLRYSGDEIVNEPAASARDLLDYCLAKWGDDWHEGEAAG